MSVQKIKPKNPDPYLGKTVGDNTLARFAHLNVLTDNINEAIANISIGDPNAGVFYVSKNYTGIGNSLVQGYTIADITSNNTSYTTQLSKAKMGDANNAYPDPWAARNAAMTAITAGTITKAVIIVLRGTWTYGYSIDTFNGSATGNPAIATLPDVGFLNVTDNSSLLKHNIDYYFYPNTELINICKFVQIFIGYTLDATDAVFKSGIYGHGNITGVYGTQEGLSYRAFYIDNARAEVTLEASNIILQRAWMMLYNYKSVNIKADKWLSDNLGSIVFENGSGREGDGSIQSLTVDINLAARGQNVYPYPSQLVTSIVSPFIGENGGISTGNVRQKVKTFTIKNAQSTCSGWRGLFWGLYGYSTNNIVTINIDTYKHVRAFDGQPGALVEAANTSNTLLKQNNTLSINIKTASVQTAFNEPRSHWNRNASNLRNTVVFNIDYVELPNVWIFDSIFAIPMTNVAIVGEKPIYTLNIKNAIAFVGYVIKGYTFSGYTHNSNFTLRNGFLKTVAANPVIYINGAGGAGIIDSCTIISGGTASIDGNSTGKTIYCKNTVTNVAVNAANVTVDGTLTVDPLILNYV